MAAASASLDRSFVAPDFRLPATDRGRYSYSDIAGPRGTVIAFICNHCPYVQAVVDRMVADARILAGEGIGFAAICSNDADAYPEDGLEGMVEFARRHGFPFPYLHDERQEAARAYGAACTPDFFGFDAARRLVYRGRLDAGRKEPPPPGASRELVEAMRRAARGEAPIGEPLPSMGCSIKWKRD